MYSHVSKIMTESQHEVQFYDQDSFLIEILGRHVEEGLALGESVLLLTTPPHREALVNRLNGHRLLERYMEFDAADTLSQFMVHGWPDSAKFQAVMGQLLRQATENGSGRVRVFGEMVAILWERGEAAAALHLESLWNQLAAEHSFSLLCAYPIRGFSSHTHTHTFQKICSAHSMVRPAENAIVPGPGDHMQADTTLATLQQKAVALESEVRRREELQRTLLQREEELADFLENAVECVHQVGPDGKILWANKAELTMLGYEAHEYFGHSITEFHVDEPIINDILQRLLRGETLCDYPSRLRCKDGSVKDVLIHSNVRWENGTFRYTRCFTRDISERKRIEQELDQRVEERTRELVESQQKLRALAAQLSLAERRVRNEIATELHDYLAQMLIVTRLKLAQATQETEEHTKIRQVLKEADDVLHESILYTRSLMAELSPPILEFGLPMGLRWLAEKFQSYQLTVETHIPDGIVLNLSESQIGLIFQSVRELLMNVVKHAQTDRAQIFLRLQDHMLYLEVVDQGRGCDQATTLTPNVPPLNLEKFGLFSIRERMEALGGRFDFHSSLDQGTRARLLLPLEPVQDNHCSSEGTSTVMAAVSDLTKSIDLVRVLLVEDHAVVREGLRGVLETYPDIEVVAEAEDGEAAVAQAIAYEPDVVIMDINMPKLDGIEATRQIKARFPKTIVIGLSVHQANQVEPALLEAGGSAYVTKESAAACLYKAIQKAIR
ncbi:response regulator [Candidatus Nitrospira allomarina]|uniref:histidine kinase n=1 Tax=Candidatus Nitrospira allomarina TaxID=3020900 RepID=A0AA96JTT8_9BACT|nr:response regulator [Candidatus Nitrospira allomarina]WNM59938.1 response regulator [Candidatus Nitrospira allomarina]